MKEKLQKIASLGGTTLLAYLLLRGCDDTVTLVREKQAELDRLCGQDRSACVESTETLCSVDFQGGANCSKVKQYSTMTPVRK